MRTMIVACATVAVSAVMLESSGASFEIEPGDDIASALSSCSQGDELVFADGTYSFSAPVVIPDGVTVRSASGDPDKAILDGGDATPIFVTSSTAPAACISGFMFRNARNTVAGEDGVAMESCGGAVRFTSPCDDANTGSVISNCVFASCHSDTGFGGALMIPGGTTVADCVFTNCTAMMKGEDGSVNGGGARGGGAIYAVAKTANVVLKGSLFIDCGCSNGVGVVNCGYYYGHKQTGGTPSKNAYGAKVYGCAFSNNWAYGSSCCLNLKTRHVEDTVFSGNKTYASITASGASVNPFSVIWRGQPNGAGGDAQDLSTATTRLNIATVTNFFKSCVFDGNVVQYAASRAVNGGLFYHGGNIPFLFTNCTFTANKSCGRGTVFKLDNGPAWFFDCVFEGNANTYSASSYDGFPVVDLRYSQVSAAMASRLERCRFIGNTAKCNGGIVDIGNYAKIIDCEFRANVKGEGSAYRTGIVNTPDATRGNITIRGCLFANNTNNTTRTDSVVYLANMNVSNGQAATGGANIVVESCTFVGNVANGTSNANRCGVVHVGDNSSSPAVMRNCLFANNKSKSGSALVNFSYGSNNMSTYVPANVTYCAEDTGKYPFPTSGDDYDYHNITGKTVTFRKSANEDYVPRSGPWINGGLNCAWMSGARDIYGRDRIIGGRVDIGCSECDVRGVLLCVW